MAVWFCLALLVGVLLLPLLVGQPFRWYSVGFIVAVPVFLGIGVWRYHEEMK